MGAGKVNASQSGVFSFGICRIQNTGFLDGLDARDRNNQPVLTKKAKDGLTEIFESGLFNLLTASELYSAAETLASLSKALNLAAQNFAGNVPAAVKNLIAVFLPTIKQLQNILVCLAGLFGFGFAVSRFSICDFQFSLPYMHAAPVVLRC